MPKTPLGPADLSYKGCFKLPSGAYPGSNDQLSRLAFTAYANHGTALALRIVGGQRRFLTIGHINGGGKISEFALPATLAQTVASAPIAPAVNYWNKTPYTVRPSAQYPNGNDFGVLTIGLYWDEPRQVLWWAFGDTFDAAGVGPTLGYAKLTTPNGATSTAQAFGPFDVNSQTMKVSNVRGWIMELPQSVRDTLLAAGAPGGPNYRLAIGNRFDSVLGTTQFGHALTAFTEPQDNSVPTAAGAYPWTPANRFVASTKSLLKFPPGIPGNKQNGVNYNYTLYTRRDQNYSVMDVPVGAPPQQGGAGGTNVNPSGGTGYIQSVDIFQGGVWVETANKAGLLIAGGISGGRNWYTEDGYIPTNQPTNPNRVQIPNDPRGVSGWVNGVFNGGRIGCEFFDPAFWFYSEQDLINGVAGNTQLNPVVMHVPAGTGAVGKWTFGAPVYDAATRLLYVSQDKAYAGPGGELYPVVHCWEVLDTVTGQPPGVPQNIRITVL